MLNTTPTSLSVAHQVFSMKDQLEAAIQNQDSPQESLALSEQKAGCTSPTCASKVSSVV